MSDLALAAFAAETNSHVVEEPRAGRFRRFLRGFDEASYRAGLRAQGLRFLGRSDSGYPALLCELHDPPAGLFVRGAAGVELLARPAVAVVGARACSSYGAQVARLLGRELAAAGLVVISGLARGVDGEAHRGALEAKGTIVVLESVLENGKTTYEGQVKTKAGKKLSMELDADGKPVKK